MKPRYFIISVILILTVAITWSYKSQYDEKTKLADEYIKKGNLVVAERLLKEANSVNIFGGEEISRLTNLIKDQKRYDSLYSDINICRKYDDYVEAYRVYELIGSDYYRLDELDKLMTEIEKKKLAAKGNFLNSVECKEYTDALKYYEILLKNKDVIDLTDVQENIDKFTIEVTEFVIKDSSKKFKDKQYEEAIDELTKVRVVGVNTEKIDKLINEYTDKMNEDFKAKRDAERFAYVIENMNIYENSYGGVKIAVSDVKSNNSLSNGRNTYTRTGNGKFISVYISAKNFGDSTEHVNPNYFTLITKEGYACNYHDLTLSKKYIDAVDLQPNTYTEGWLIFYTAESDEYTLSFKSIYSKAYKSLVIY